MTIFQIQIIELIIFVISFIIAQGFSFNWHRVQSDIKWSQTCICFLIMIGPTIIFNLLIRGILW